MRFGDPATPDYADPEMLKIFDFLFFYGHTHSAILQPVHLPDAENLRLILSAHF